VADVIALPTRTKGEVDLPPCGNAWGPLEDPDAGGSKGPHVCFTWSGWPHICRCTHCRFAPEASHER
jgi:hypothetical protein